MTQSSIRVFISNFMIPENHRGIFFILTIIETDFITERITGERDYPESILPS